MKKVFFLILVFFAFFSCKKDSTTTPQKFEFVVSENYIPENYQYWIVVSDNNNVIFSEQIQNGQTYQTEKITAKLVDVHIFEYYESQSYQALYATTYTDVAPDEWTLNRPYPWTYLGPIYVSISDLADIKRWCASASRSSNSSTSIESRSLNAYVNPENVLVSYLPADNSPMQYKYVQNITPNQALTFTMSDFQPATGLISYTLPAYDYFYMYLSGYNYNPNLERYRLTPSTSSNSEVSNFDYYYPNNLFQNYYLYFYIFDNVDVNRCMDYYNYGAIPSTLPTISYAVISLTNENNIDLVSASIENSQNYQYFEFDYSISEESQYFEWSIISKPNSTNSNSLPEIPAEIKQKANLFQKSKLEFDYTYVLNYLNGPAASYDDYISMCIKPSKYFNEVVNEYAIYYKYPGSTSKNGTKEREPNFEINHHRLPHNQH